MATTLATKTYQLNNGLSIPAIGLGIFPHPIPSSSNPSPEYALTLSLN